MDVEKERKNKQKLIIEVILVIALFLYLGMQYGNASLTVGGEGGVTLFETLKVFFAQLYNPLHCFPTKPLSVLLFTGIGIIISLYMWVNYLQHKNMMRGKEHGSASFNVDYAKTEHDFIMSPRILEANFGHSYPTKMASGGRKQCKQKKFSGDEKRVAWLNSQIYSKGVGLSMDTKLTQLNLNCIVFGGSGAGKSRFFITPNLLQANSSYVVTDPSGELMANTGKFLEDQGYTIKCLNIQNMAASCRYNPFAYVKEDEDLLIMVNCLINNIEGPKKGGSGDNKFWEESSQTLLAALCGYLFETQPMEKRNFANVLRLLNMADASDEREVDKDDLDLLFDDLEQANPESYAVSQYKVFKSAGTGKTAQNILISTSSIFARFFNLKMIKNLTYKDEIHLEEIGQKKTALFIVTPQGDTTYNWLASMLYTQLFATLYKQGEENGRRKGTSSVALEVPVRCLIDEAANVGVIPNFAEKMSTMRKYGISCCPVYQNQSQVKALFKDDWESIAGNCDTMLFLGGIDASTVKTVSERLGKGTINQHNDSYNHSTKQSGSTSVSTTGRELMTTTEIEQMPNDHCITFIRSMKPFYDYKYPLEKHPNYKNCGDANPAQVYHSPFHLEYDAELMAQNNVLATTDAGYVKPERVAGVTQAQVDRVKEKQGANKNTDKGNTARKTPIGGLKPATETIQKLDLSQYHLSDDDLNMEKYEDTTCFDDAMVSAMQNHQLGRELWDKISKNLSPRRTSALASRGLNGKSEVKVLARPEKVPTKEEILKSRSVKGKSKPAPMGAIQGATSYALPSKDAAPKPEETEDGVSKLLRESKETAEGLIEESKNASQDIIDEFPEEDGYEDMPEMDDDPEFTPEEIAEREMMKQALLNNLGDVELDPEDAFSEFGEGAF